MQTLLDVLEETREYAKELEERLHDATDDADDLHIKLHALKLDVREAVEHLHDAFHASNMNHATEAENYIVKALELLINR